MSAASLLKNVEFANFYKHFTRISDKLGDLEISDRFRQYWATEKPRMESAIKRESKNTDVDVYKIVEQGDELARRHAWASYAQHSKEEADKATARR